MILCSPSPGTSWPENTIFRRCHTGSSFIFLRMKYLAVETSLSDTVPHHEACSYTTHLMCMDTRAMNSVPGVMQFESNTSSSVSTSPFRCNPSTRRQR